MSLTFDGPDASFLHGQAASSAAEGSDVEIELMVRAVLAELPACELTHIEVSSHGGVVRLDGTVTDGRWLARFKNKLTGAMPSVLIDDRLDWVVPDCGIGYA